ncbi:RNA polymerase sigma factor SigJ [Asanoa ishikariensis]|uniref:RNA polymerase sigma-70 factor, ECF subfamily n=1 Tax=Asanoa ishikariensis TaxID=137265 RepID=A0A1H3UUF3_9ACTN|nr:RNA polymerase sigma factor SigJ [Asanoa ishikariensis]GIF65013.1 RNA polymerase sigma factor SigJ [Asanoa ishikariensis]SDZ65886.1 RNA polymerase sigma-70 factor, ECF subfamily [Asanoa ishikariensis]
MQDLASEFEAERDHLTSVAYRMLGSRAEAEDAVQETWLRYSGALTDPAARAEIRELRGWLTTTTARICLDVLRSARVRREAYPGQWLPEPLVTRLGPSDFAPDPADRAVLGEELGTALMVVLERLTPEQRVAFVLHDAFGVPFDEIATAMGSTVPAARQLASRARRAVTDGAPRNTASRTEQRRVVQAFLDATETGDIDALMAVLAPDVVFVGDSGGHFPAARQPIVGAERVATFVLGLLKLLPKEAPDLRFELVEVDGGIGVLADATYKDGRPFRSVLSFAIDGGRVTAAYNQLNPEKIARVLS